MFSRCIRAQFPALRVLLAKFTGQDELDFPLCALIDLKGDKNCIDFP